ncbi:unnamed protein product [marine sediment metagenome]|uniref:Methyltransferase domain-containing protein n=1 Tax=marine sediment metagenome TaxID=412755 RepID=X1TP26_9ZZZZ
MEDCSCDNQCNSVTKCDIFDFMAKHVGMTVIHPGGFEVTNQLIHSLKISSDSKVIDIACGKGTTAILIAEKYGCHVVAIDIDEKLIQEAKHLTGKKRNTEEITFIKAFFLGERFRYSRSTLVW